MIRTKLWEHWKFNTPKIDTRSKFVIEEFDDYLWVHHGIKLEYFSYNRRIIYINSEQKATNYASKILDTIWFYGEISIASMTEIQKKSVSLQCILLHGRCFVLNGTIHMMKNATKDSFQTMIWNQPNHFEACGNHSVVVQQFFCSEYVSALIENYLKKS